MDEIYKLIKNIVKKTFIKTIADKSDIYYVLVGISNKHVHLSQIHLKRLFGTDYQLTPLKDLSQPGQYAARETVELFGPKGKIKEVRVLGPPRKDTQVEISVTDSYRLGVSPVVRMSGKLENTPGIKLTGPQGKVDLRQGVIVAARHLHISEQEALKYGLKDNDKVSIKKSGKRGIVFRNVIVRVSSNYSLEFHIDTDEANAAGVKNGELLLMEKE